MPVHVLEPLAALDLKTFLERADRIGASEVQLRAEPGVLLASVPVFEPAGLLDQMPTVIGLRTFAIAPGERETRVCAVHSILERIARLDPGAPAVIEWPAAQVLAPWAGVTPPQAGWEAVASLAAGELAEAARLAAAEVQQALPTDPGQAVLAQVRRQVWARPFGDSALPLGAAFAADALGFLGDDPAALFRAGRWLRLRTERGHVLVRAAH